MRGAGAVLVLALVGVAHANGRSPSVQTITFRPGNADHVLAGATFGALHSTDAGATWTWMCEAAVGYGGIYDPDYALTAAGDAFATTSTGLRVRRDGCTYAQTPLGAVFTSQVEVSGPLGVIAGVSDVTGSPIVSSADDGVTFPTSATPGIANDWWQSLRVAPSDPQRVYLAGYRIDDGTRYFLLHTSDTAGASFTSMTTTNMLVSQSSVVSIAGVSPTTPTTVYALVTFENGTTTDGAYVSADAGATWTRMVGGLGPIAFLARANGELVVSGPSLAKVSTDGGMIWNDLPSTTPRLTCLAERPDGVVWACTQPFVTGNGIMTSSDLATWTPVLRFADLAAPVDCPAGTTQHDTCLPQWCFLRQQLGITADPTGCEPAPDGSVDGLPDAAVEPGDASPMPRPPASNEGCCNTSGQAPPSLLLVLCVAALVLRRRHAR